MKKVILTLAAALIVVGAQAGSGFNKKKVYVGGSVGYTSTSVKSQQVDQNTGQVQQVSTDGSSAKLILDFGYDLDKVNSIGVQVGVLTGLAMMGSLDVNNFTELILGGVGAYSDMTKGTSDVSGIRFAPYIRHNLISKKGFDIFIEGVLGYEQLKTKQSGDDGTGQIIDSGMKVTLFELVGRPGLLYKIDKNFGILIKFGSVGYQSMKSTQFVGNNNLDGPEATRFGFSASTSGLAIGVQYHF